MRTKFLSKIKLRISVLFYKSIFFYSHFTMKERIFHYASSLSFYNIFSIIPIFLMIFSIMTSFPSFQTKLQYFKDIFLNNFLPKDTQKISEILDQFLLNGQNMGFIGFLIAIFSSFIFFRSYEDISSYIFQCKKRNLFDSFITYWILITLVPFIITFSLYANIYLVKNNLNFFNWIFNIIPFLSTWITFAMLFRIAANKALNFLALFLSSFIGSFFWYLIKYAFFYYMSIADFYKNIYGSVSIVMFVFIWIYISWIIFLVAMRMCEFIHKRAISK